VSAVLANWELDFPQQSNLVDISIVICAYNKSDYTLRCLSAVNQSLKFNLATTEVILVDDCSTDDTQTQFQTVRGLKYLRNETNQGFLKSANRGAAAATGKYVLFLNNDTEPIGNWLDPLLTRAESSPDIGAVGSKLLNDDGTVQEAGGIIFSDGSGWNYGRSWQASDPRINYPRPVDYCSGAVLLVRSDLLQKLGGFDINFAPAYYEDTDLCFALRKLGYSVWYEPNSVVIHFEGISHGKDTSSGIKSVQERNRIKFLAKWQQELTSHLSNNPDLVLTAANRQLAARVLLIDHQIPTPDQDSGSLRISELIKCMMQLNCLVTFVPQNGLRKQGYSEQLAQLGVEVLPATAENLELLKARAGFYDFIWTSRPDPTRFFFQELQRAFAEVPVIYDTVDLHFLRLKRNAELTGADEDYRAAIAMELNELELFERVAKVVVVSDYEIEVLKPKVKTPISLLPNVHLAVDYIPGPNTRDGLLFVGGFAHQPNEDAVNWFITEIFPQVLMSAPETKLRIVGSGIPNWLLELAHSNIEVLGWVPDLTPIYAQTRVCIAPLRYGAGVKGKVGEAMSHGVPMVVTTIAAEGMGLIHNKHTLIADEPAEFAAGVIKLLQDNKIWQQLAAAAQSHICENYGRASTLNRVKQLLEL
jgi:GT2 family glycosyltransferase/glycosyltransferase involved in cell wall biosynthesis